MINRNPTALVYYRTLFANSLFFTFETWIHYFQVNFVKRISSRILQKPSPTLCVFINCPRCHHLSNCFFFFPRRLWQSGTQCPGSCTDWVRFSFSRPVCSKRHEIYMWQPVTPLGFGFLQTIYLATLYMFLRGFWHVSNQRSITRRLCTSGHMKDVGLTEWNMS